MTREEIYQECLKKIRDSNVLMMELATGTGKSFLSIRLSNYLLNSKYYEGREVGVRFVAEKYYTREEVANV